MSTFESTAGRLISYIFLAWRMCFMWMTNLSCLWVFFLVWLVVFILFCFLPAVARLVMKCATYTLCITWKPSMQFLSWPVHRMSLRMCSEPYHQKPIFQFLWNLIWLWCMDITKVKLGFNLKQHVFLCFSFSYMFYLIIWLIVQIILFLSNSCTCSWNLILFFSPFYPLSPLLTCPYKNS